MVKTISRNEKAEAEKPQVDLKNLGDRVTPEVARELNRAADKLSNAMLKLKSININVYHHLVLPDGDVRP